LIVGHDKTAQSLAATTTASAMTALDVVAAIGRGARKASSMLWPASAQISGPPARDPAEAMKADVAGGCFDNFAFSNMPGCL
jgi:hypothetical protein